MSIPSAEKHALGEIARQIVDQLIREGREPLEFVQATLDPVPEPAARALKDVLTWLLEHPASCRRGLRSIKSPGSGFLSAPEGPTPRPPFDRER